MPSGYWGGLIEGFQGRREAELENNFKQEQLNRAASDRVFQYLLQSRDPMMQQLALQGLAEPISKKKGFRGFMGEFESNPAVASVLARMNEMVPDEGPGPAAHAPGLSGGPPAPGSAAMSTNQPVRPGSAPIQMPGVPLPPEPPPMGASGGGPGGGGPAATASPLGTMGTPPVEGAAGAPIPPPPSLNRWTRRGTGVPTAEEVAEMNARIPLETRIAAAHTNLPADDANRAIMGILGAPQSPRQFMPENAWGVRLQKDGPVVPVSFDTTTGSYILPDGTPVPKTAEMVRMTGAAGGGAGLTSVIRDSPAVRMQYGIEPSEVTPSGYWKIKQFPDGSTQVMASEYTPPPAFAGTGTILDANNNAMLVGVPRGGGAPVPLGASPNPQASTDQSVAQSLLADVQQRITAAETPRLPGLPKKPLTAAQRDQIVKQAAGEAGLPYTNYFELQRATRIAPARQVTPKPGTPSATTAPTGTLTTAERVRQRAIEITQGGGSATAPPSKPSAPARATGAGPNR